MATRLHRLAIQCRKITITHTADRNIHILNSVFQCSPPVLVSRSLKTTSGLGSLGLVKMVLLPSLLIYHSTIKRLKIVLCVFHY